MNKNQQKAINTLIDSNDSAQVLKGLNHFIAAHGLPKAQKSKKIKKIVDNLLKSDNEKAIARGLTMHSKLYETKQADKLFIKSPEYKILMANAGSLTSMI